MKISIITACFNAADTISDCLASVRSQTIPAEHIIIDGSSTDNTLEMIQGAGTRDQGPVAAGARDSGGTEKINPESKIQNPKSPLILSEPDEGMYDAMNKGIRLATGDIVGILNADDFYVNDRVLEKVAAVFDETGVDSLFADLVFVRPDNLDRVVRYYRADHFTPELLAWGWMPPHPTFFVRREIYEKYGLFKTDYRIAADYELIVRFLARHRVSYRYLPEVIVKMRTGGVSTRGIRSNLILNQEILRACRENGIATNYFKVYSKYFTKLFQLLERPTMKATH